MNIKSPILGDKPYSSRSRYRVYGHGFAYRAIVIGGSIAGLLTSKILTNYFERLTIIKRDRFPEQPEPHKQSQFNLSQKSLS